MVFSSTTFLFLFLPVTIALYYTIGQIGSRTRNTILLLASLGFYAWGEPLFVFAMIATVAINWLLVLVMDRRDAGARKLFCGIAIAVDLALLFVFKYASFVAANLAWLLKSDAITLNIALPIGISFFTFQIMSYVFDVYYRTERPQRNFFRVLLYISLFPQLIAGPIVRYSSVALELDHRCENFTDFSAGIIRFTYGLGKKVLLANYLAVSADFIFDASSRSVLAAWLGAACYTLQIYFDFSGYSDMAIGLGRIFGFHFSENFNYPYIARTITEFWRRWHISLSSWFRDYVYIPLGGSHVVRSRWLVNFFTVWLLTGIWHGANWTFITWGLFYFVVLTIEKLSGLDRRLAVKSSWWGHAYTMVIVMLAWVIFRANSIGDAVSYIGNMFGIGSDGFIDALFFENFRMSATLLVCSIILAMPIMPIIDRRLTIAPHPTTRALWTVATSAAVFALSILSCVATTYQPFIYFNF